MSDHPNVKPRLSFARGEIAGTLMFASLGSDSFRRTTELLNTMSQCLCGKVGVICVVTGKGSAVLCAWLYFISSMVECEGPDTVSPRCLLSRPVNMLSEIDK